MRPKAPGEYMTSTPSSTYTPGSSSLSGRTRGQSGDFYPFPGHEEAQSPREGQCDLVIILIHAFSQSTCTCWALPTDYLLWWAFRIYKSIRHHSCPQWAHRSVRLQSSKSRAKLASRKPQRGGQGERRKDEQHMPVLSTDTAAHTRSYSRRLQRCSILAYPKSRNQDLQANSAFQP